MVFVQIIIQNSSCCGHSHWYEIIKLAMEITLILALLAKKAAERAGPPPPSLFQVKENTSPHNGCQHLAFVSIQVVAQRSQALVAGDPLNHVEGHPPANGSSGQRTAEAVR